MAWHTQASLIAFPLQVLTRRDQLKLKQEKELKRKQEQEQKKAEKAEKAEKKEDLKTKKRNTDKGEKSEVVEEPEPKKRSRKKKEVEPTGDEQPEADAEIPDPTAEGLEVPQDAKPKRRAKATAKPKASPKAKISPKRKAKAKAKGRAKAKAKAALKDEVDQHDEDEMPTPKRKLFQSEDGSEDEAEGKKDQHLRVDAKTGDVKPLKDIVDEYVPGRWRATRPSSSKEDPEDEQEPSKKKGKGGSKGRGRGKGELSPFAKKEVKRRRKVEQSTMEAEAVEDGQITAICLAHLGKVEDLTFEKLKEYLQCKFENKFKKGVLNCYWSRASCGVKCPDLGDGTLKKAPEIAYFGKYGTAPNWNANVALTYISACIMVSRLSGRLGVGSGRLTTKSNWMM